MKPFLPFILFLSIAFVGFGQQDYPDSDLGENRMVNGLKEGKWIEDIDIHGQIIDHSKAGTVLSDGEYQVAIYHAGKFDGVVRLYVKGGLVSETSYSNGVLNGVTKTYYGDGLIESEKPYTEGKLNGVVREFYDTGLINVISNRRGKGLCSAEMYITRITEKSEHSYINNSLNGTVKEYYGNGVVETETPYLRNRKNGVVKYYYEDGTIDWTELYVGGAFRMKF